MTSLTETRFANHAGCGLNRETAAIESTIFHRNFVRIGADALPSYLVATPLAAGRCFFVRKDQAVALEPEIAALKRAR